MSYFSFPSTNTTTTITDKYAFDYLYDNLLKDLPKHTNTHTHILTHHLMCNKYLRNIGVCQGFEMHNSVGSFKLSLQILNININVKYTIIVISKLVSLYCYEAEIIPSDSLRCIWLKSTFHIPCIIYEIQMMLIT